MICSCVVAVFNRIFFFTRHIGNLIWMIYYYCYSRWGNLRVDRKLIYIIFPWTMLHSYSIIYIYELKAFSFKSNAFFCFFFFRFINIIFFYQAYQCSQSQEAIKTARPRWLKLGIVPLFILLNYQFDGVIGIISLNRFVVNGK